jgi:hypothetical protein
MGVDAALSFNLTLIPLNYSLRILGCKGAHGGFVITATFIPLPFPAVDRR